MSRLLLALTSFLLLSSVECEQGKCSWYGMELINCCDKCLSIIPGGRVNTRSETARVAREGTDGDASAPRDNVKQNLETIKQIILRSADSQDPLLTHEEMRILKKMSLYFYDTYMKRI